MKGLNTGARAALEAMSGGIIDAGSAKCEPGYQGASLLAGAGSAWVSVIGVGQGVMAVRAAGGVRAAAVAAWNAAKARPKQLAAAARGIRDSVRGTAARVKALTGPNCFVAGTPVAIPGGSKPIEKLKRGDRVLSRDPNTGRATTRRVVETTRRTTDSVLTLELSASKGGPVLQRLKGTSTRCSPGSFGLPGAIRRVRSRSDCGALTNGAVGRCSRRRHVPGSHGPGVPMRISVRISVRRR